MSTPKRTYTCQECGKPFWSYKSPGNVGKFCTECLPIVRRRNVQKLHAHNAKAPEAIVTSTCRICGCSFVGKNKYRKYQACERPECRLELRRQAGFKVAKKHRDTRIIRECLRCGCEFKTDSRFIRICVTCKDERRLIPIYSDVWGGRSI